MPINIIKYNPRLLEKSGVLYCGRKSKIPEKIGLGNPFFHKPVSNAIFRVNSLEESLTSYRKWLWKLLTAYRSDKVATLEHWEILYLNRFLYLTKLIKEDKVSDLMCFCINITNYKYSKNQEIQCHTQILYGACIWFNQQSFSI